MRAISDERHCYVCLFVDHLEKSQSVFSFRLAATMGNHPAGSGENGVEKQDKSACRQSFPLVAMLGGP
jgi:hypothetical protein